MFRYSGDEVSPGNPSIFADLLPQVNINGIEQNELVSVCKEVSNNRLRYAQVTVLIECWKRNEEEPNFVIIKDIIITKTTKIFRCERLSALEFVPHLNSFAVVRQHQLINLTLSELQFVWPQLCRNLSGQMYIMLNGVDDVWHL